MVPQRNLNYHVYGKYMFFIVGKYSLDIETFLTLRKTFLRGNIGYSMARNENSILESSVYDNLYYKDN